ncbi:MAG: copper homeostasis protein CutC [Erysipelotrichales bacterium]|nr:MAG: copper homeostasis protein CutC [Erysipelotrichales bacterium]
MKRILCEVCVGSIDDMKSAISCDIDRIELNQALELGGLTPSRALFLAARRMTQLPIVVMVRPHNGFAPYSTEEFEMMLDEAEFFVANGADGIVFGCLDAAKNVDVGQTKKMVEVVKDKLPIFHKAFDHCIDLDKASEDLIGCGIKRVLTSGGMPASRLTEGAQILRRLHATYGDRLEFLPGGGVDEKNILEVVRVSQCGQVHMSAKKVIHDPFSNEIRTLTDADRLENMLRILRDDKI